MLEETRNIDKRVIKTKRSICNAFIELLQTKDINEITITDIANTAEVNRKTIYNYYAGIHEILGEIEDRLVYSFENLMKDVNIREALENPSILFTTITTVISANIDFYGKLMHIDANSQLTNKIVKSLEERVRDLFITQNLFNNHEVELISTYIVTGIISVYQYWFNSGRKMPINEFSEDVRKLVYSGVSELIKK